MGLERITGIVIDVIRHNDRHNVVTLYTRERGRMSFLTSSGTGRTARLRMARLKPLSVITAEINLRPSRELQFLGEVSPVTLWRELYFNPLKSSIVMFLYEFLNSFLRQSEADESLWRYIAGSLHVLDEGLHSVANFHIGFLIGLLHYAGIQPDMRSEGPYFDMREGCFVKTVPLHRDVLSGPDTARLRLLARMTPANSRWFRLSGVQRKALLDGLLKYYSIHFPGVANLKSPDVLSETLK